MYQIATLALDDPQQQAWDQFVRAQADGSFFHLAGWQRVLNKALNHPTYYLYATENQQIVGVLPLAWVNSRLFGNALVSTPFCVYGGALGEPAVRRALEQKAIEIGTELGVDHVELRYKDAQDNDWITRSQHATFGCELAADDAAILAAIKKNQRALIRRAQQSDLTTHIETDNADFYQIYSESLRNLGTPVFSKKLIDALQQAFPADTEILTIRQQGTAVSSVFNFYYQGQVLPYYGGGKPIARELKSNDFMYYQLMCHAKANKECHFFDFGRSKLDSGAYSYKKHWGMQNQLLHYQFKLIKAEQLSNLSPNNPKYQLFIKMWQKLPLAISRWLGPKLAHFLG
ncbi:peptidoglycan bridge formation protein FemAB [Rheinheimera sp. SA_1]|uniref:FemAB family XrtA/PEP-CTERM system-associated protein n=2 Tax=Bacteria TaxID=2 RepID=UPI00080085BF|nr:FemAB family XrtA/PEP-CTERM system-associated protein [Rheinheimera sp. SA_1]OBP14606.1 peptidoglycan bridge formation protein FemAB [Rheinheimera sp. SA_1]